MTDDRFSTPYTEADAYNRGIEKGRQMAFKQAASDLQMVILTTEGDSADVPKALRDNLCEFIQVLKGEK